MFAKCSYHRQNFNLGLIIRVPNQSRYNRSMSVVATEHADLTGLNTLAIAASADFLVPITAVDQITEAVELARRHQLPLIPWGSGSNVVIGVAALHAVIAKIELTGRAITVTPTHTDVHVGAGENWDALVAWSTDQGLQGIESLSLVPGTVGAAPVQNVGAYGQEVSETITAIEAYDLKTNQLVQLSNADCQFGYRDSIFKHAGKGRYIITTVSFRLKPAKQVAMPTYATLAAELTRRQITRPTVADIRESVIAVRQARLPDPAAVPTAGSFFHNPIISAAAASRLQEQHPKMPHWPAPDNQVKLAAAWLVEQCGLKGVMRDGVGLYDKQAICLINPGHRPAAEVLAFRDYVIDVVQDRFGVRLQMEPELIT
jgi:UDP-N-acetylmuramate dehydrogenase